ncbi:hypothetical protein BDR22DRAFT_642566 [Usnea florida]
MPGIFTFGIFNPFKFTFRARPKPDEPCGTLAKLPVELRCMVYSNVLNCEMNISQANDFLGPKPPIMAEEAKHIGAIDAALLRTCRTIYHETIVVLYAFNVFEFDRLVDLQHFAHAGLENKPFGFYCVANRSLFPKYSAPYGRLTMIHKLVLRISPDRQYRMGTARIWSSWCNLFYSPEGQPRSVGFPALRVLVLDFTEWRLNAENDSKLRVGRPYMRPVASTRSTLHLSQSTRVQRSNLALRPN